MVTEQTFFSGPSLCWYIELFEFCGSFRDLAHASCIQSANNVRGGVLKSTLVVDDDSVDTCTVCFQSHGPDHLFSLITDAHAPQRLKKTIHGIVIIFHHYFILSFFSFTFYPLALSFNLLLFTLCLYDLLPLISSLQPLTFNL